jgi:hypothetical protein
MALLGTTQVFVRGATVQFATNFYDVNNNLIQPDSATINIVLASGGNPITLAMVPPSGSVTTWTALWDTRNITTPGIVYWSIHTGTGDPIPVTAEDGQFQLSANPANLASF